MSETSEPLPSENWYARHPMVRAIVAAMPHIGGSLDVLISRRLEDEARQRSREFFAALEAQQATLTEDMFADSDFLHAVAATFEAVVRTRSAEKRHLFACLLATYAKTGSFAAHADKNDEFLEVLKDLQPREMQVLLILRRFEASEQKPASSDGFERSGRFWDRFEAAVEVEAGLAKDQLSGFLSRLNRTGLYRTYAPGAALDYSGYCGCTTAYFDAFVRSLGTHPEGENS